MTLFIAWILMDHIGGFATHHYFMASALWVWHGMMHSAVTGSRSTK